MREAMQKNRWLVTIAVFLLIVALVITLFPSLKRKRGAGNVTFNITSIGALLARGASR